MIIEDSAKVIATNVRVGLKVLGNNLGGNLMLNILSPNSAYVLITMEEVEDFGNDISYESGL